MSAEPKKRGRGRPRKAGALEKERKTRTKNMRMTERAKFTMELWSGFLRTTEAGFIDQASEAHADALAQKHGVAWRDFWHAHEGVRWIRVYAAVPRYPFTDDHEKRRAFVLLHRQFFFLESTSVPMVANVPLIEALCGPMPDDERRWEKLDAFRALAAEGALEPGKAMAAELARQGFTPPSWPPVNP
jgi:hypothetical protein